MCRINVYFYPEFITCVSLIFFVFGTRYQVHVYVYVKLEFCCRKGKQNDDLECLSVTSVIDVILTFYHTYYIYVKVY